jgi:hypothetical protein
MKLVGGRHDRVLIRLRAAWRSYHRTRYVAVHSRESEVAVFAYATPVLLLHVCTCLWFSYHLLLGSLHFWIG